MTTSALAARVNERGRYQKRDGSPVDAFQVHGRTRNYGSLFERDGSRVRLIETETGVGRKRGSSVARQPRKRSGFSDEEIIERATSEFVRTSVGGIEEWLNGLELSNVHLRIDAKSRRRVFVSGRRISGFYYTKEWIYAWLYPYTQVEAEDLKTRLSKPWEVEENVPGEGFIRFHISTPQDLYVYKRALDKRFRPEP